MGSCKYYGVVSSMLDPPTIKLRIEFLAQNLIMHSIGIDFWPTLCQKQPSHLTPSLPLCHTAQQFFSRHSQKQETFYGEELLRLKSITTAQQMLQNDLVDTFR